MTQDGKTNLFTPEAGREREAGRYNLLKVWSKNLHGEKGQSTFPMMERLKDRENAERTMFI